MAQKQGLQYVEYRLNEWADWSKKGNGFGLGFPSKTAEAKLKECGGIWIASKGRKPFISHPSAEEMEQYIVQMHGQAPPLATTIKTHYLRDGTDSQKSKKLDLTCGQYRRRLELAKYWLFGRLNERQ